MVSCPICAKNVKEVKINAHIDSDCQDFVIDDSSSSQSDSLSSQKNGSAINFFQPSSARKLSSTVVQSAPLSTPARRTEVSKPSPAHDDLKRKRVLEPPPPTAEPEDNTVKRSKPTAFQKAAPLAERMRPQSLDEVCGQDLVGHNGILRSLIEQDRVPSMILWGGAGTGKTTIARVIATMVGSRFVEINSTTSGIAECKKIFAEARNELGLTGRKTILFCDEIHRFSKTQQDVLLGPVESGVVTLVAATTENPSFKVQNALLSRCRTFTLEKLTDDDIASILKRALAKEGSTYSPSELVDDELIRYLATFSDGDARTALNLLELAMGLSNRPGMTKDVLKKSLTKTLVYDRAGDQHYDTISAFHKSIRGSDPDAALYYLARMIQSGEDPLYIARRLIVVASEDIGLADNSMLTLAISTHSAVEKIGLPIPLHLRNAPTRLMKELGYGKEYKYNPNYKDGQVVQEYLPESLQNRRFLEDNDLGDVVDPELFS